MPPIWATGKHGNVGTEMEMETGMGMETGMEITERYGEPEPVSWAYSHQESQISLN